MMDNRGCYILKAFGRSGVLMWWTNCLLPWRLLWKGCAVYIFWHLQRRTSPVRRLQLFDCALCAKHTAACYKSPGEVLQKAKFNMHLVLNFIIIKASQVLTTYSCIIHLLSDRVSQIWCSQIEMSYRNGSTGLPGDRDWIVRHMWLRGPLLIAKH